MRIITTFRDLSDDEYELVMKTLDLLEKTIRVGTIEIEIGHRMPAWMMAAQSEEEN